MAHPFDLPVDGRYSDDPSFPIGDYSFATPVTPTQIADGHTALGALPNELRDAIAGLDAGQLDTPYRDEGWTVRQVVHHLADSHANGHARFRLTLTEERPTIRPYDEKTWAALEDACTGPVEPSLAILSGVHSRLVSLLDTVAPTELARPLVHPEVGELQLGQLVVGYAWHGRHHLAHILRLRQARGW